MIYLCADILTMLARQRYKANVLSFLDLIWNWNMNSCAISAFC